jgi:DNA invertase Pin-like site-specific DNA recombinase
MHTLNGHFVYNKPKMYNPNVKSVLGYIRVSTAEQGDDGAGLKVQRGAIEADAERRGWVLVDVIEDVASGKNLKRPGIQRALAMLAKGQADGLVCAKLDRLGRDVGDFADLLKRSTKERWALRLLDLDIDTSTSMGEAAAFVIAAFAQAERKRIGERTREGLAVKRAEGVRLGRPRSAKVSKATVERIRRQRSRGWSLQRIADKLNAGGVPTAAGGSEWRPSSVQAILNRKDQRLRSPASPAAGRGSA